MGPAEEAGELTDELLGRLAAELGLPLAPERAAELLANVRGMFRFTAELDEIDSRDVVPATVFRAEGA